MYIHAAMELEIERIGDEIRLRPAARPITGALEALASFLPSFLAAGRGEQAQQERPTL